MSLLLETGDLSGLVARSFVGVVPLLNQTEDGLKWFSSSGLFSDTAYKRFPTAVNKYESVSFVFFNPNYFLGIMFVTS